MADLTPQQWAAALLDRLGYQQTPGAMKALVGWVRAEGGNWNNSARYNPLNTTQSAPGSKTFRSVGQGAADIRIYNSWDQGLDATVQTLRNGHYGGILAGLKAGDPGAVASAIDKSPWGTHGSLIYSAIGAAPGKTVKAPSVGGSNSGASTPSTSGTGSSVPSAAGFQAPGAPQDYAGLLGSLLGQRNSPQPVQQTTLAPPQFTANVALPKTFTPLTPEQPQAQQAATGAGSLLDALRASGPTDTPGTASGGAQSLPGIAEEVIANREANGPIASSPRPKPSAGKMPKGTATFEGTTVAAWIAPILKYARQQGWKGSINSGWRSYGEQKRIYDSGVRPAAKPGTSNHEGDEWPRGAVDVSGAEQLASILRNSPYRDKLVWAGAKDPVHFSHPHNGSY